MSLDQLRSLQADRSGRRMAEMKAVAHAVAPIVSDFASTALFYVMLACGLDVRASMGIGLALGLGQFVYMLIRRRRASAMQVASVALVVLVGALTLETNDARIIFWKVSIIYLVLGGSMLRPGWMRRHVPPIALSHLDVRALAPWEQAWAVLLILTAGLNLLLAFNVSPREAAMAFGVSALASKVALFAVQYLILRGCARRSMRARLEVAAAA